MTHDDTKKVSRLNRVVDCEMVENIIKLKKEELIDKYMSRSLDQSRHALSESLFETIPNEILLHIFRYFSDRDLCTISLVCRSFQIIADLDEIWKYKCETPIKLLSKSYKQMYIEWKYGKAQRDSMLPFLRAAHWGINKHTLYSRPSLPVRPVSKKLFHPIEGFHQHPNATSHLTINLSVDIDVSKRRLTGLLSKVTVFQQQPAVLKQMIQRYYRFMQLKVSQPENTLLIPTLDIETVWQTHLFRPKIYRNDCVRLFGRVIDHSLITKHEAEKYFKEQAFIDTCHLYEQTFGEQYCPISSTSIDSSEIIGPHEPTYLYSNKTYLDFMTKEVERYFENPFSFNENDILTDFKWFDQCKTFLFETFKKILINASYPCEPSGIDLDWRALFESNKSYERFLYMAAKYPFNDKNGFIPSSYAIEFIWRCHMQEPLKYEADCLRLVGYIIDHNPQLTIEDEEMKQFSDRIKLIWKDEFQCEIETDHLFDISYHHNTSFN